MEVFITGLPKQTPTGNWKIANTEFLFREPSQGRPLSAGGDSPSKSRTSSGDAKSGFCIFLTQKLYNAMIYVHAKFLD